MDWLDVVLENRLNFLEEEVIKKLNLQEYFLGDESYFYIDGKVIKRIKFFNSLDSAFKHYENMMVVNWWKNKAMEF